MTTVSPNPGPNVVERLAADRDRFAADANRLATALGNGPTLDDLDRAEADLLAQLADVRQRRAQRAALESERRAAAAAAEFFAGLVDRTRADIERLRSGAWVNGPRPDPDPLAGLPGLVDDSREEIAAAVSGEYPTAPAVTSGGHPVAGSTSTGPGLVVATSGPGETQPDAAARPSPSAESVESGSTRRGRKGGRK